MIFGNYVRPRPSLIQRRARILSDLDVATRAHATYQGLAANFGKPGDRKLRRYWATRVADLRRQLRNLEG